MSHKSAHVEAMLTEGKYAEAKAALVAALRRRPDDAELNSLLSVALGRLGDHAGAEHYARRTAMLVPRDPAARHNLGNLLVGIGKHAEAAAVLETAARMMREAGKDDTQTLLALSNALSGMNRHGSAAEVMSTALLKKPDDARLLNNQASNLHARGDVEQALPMLRRAHQLAPRSLYILDQLCAMENYAPGVINRDRLETHRSYGAALKEECGRLEAARPLSSNPRGGRPPRIGLLSSDLRSHSVAYFVLPILEHSDRSLAEFHCYHVGTKEDAVSERLRAHSKGWKHVPRLGVVELANLIRSDSLDALIELNGHTTGHRLATMSLRCAPVQMTYFGYPNTTGVPSIDYRIVDSITDPPGSEGASTENLLRLDPLFFCYSPPRDAPPVSDPACGDGSPVTFGSFGSLLKYNEPLIETWAGVLRNVPGSRLVIMHHGLTEESVRERIVGRFERYGVERNRIDARAPALDAAGTLPAYATIDISLDTFPYNGTTTICESLFMGVPIVTMHGESCASRVGLSILKALGLEAHAARTPEEFVGIAARLAGDRSGLAESRRTLRDRFMSSPAGDGRLFAERFVKLITQACRSHDERR